MNGMLFGMSATTFFTVMGVPLLIIVLLVLWGLTFDNRGTGEEVARERSEGRP